MVHGRADEVHDGAGGHRSVGRGVAPRRWARDVQGRAVPRGWQRGHGPSPPRATPSSTCRRPERSAGCRAARAGRGARRPRTWSSTRTCRRRRVLVTVFAWATAARAVDGWLRSAPFRPVPAVATRLRCRRRGVRPTSVGSPLWRPSSIALPPRSPSRSAPFSSLRRSRRCARGRRRLAHSGERMRRLRSRVYALVLTSAPVASRLTTRGSSTGVARARISSPSAERGAGHTIDMSARDDDHRGRSGRHTELLADVSKAAEIISPLWPLTSFWRSIRSSACSTCPSTTPPPSPDGGCGHVPT